MAWCSAIAIRVLAKTPQKIEGLEVPVQVVLELGLERLLELAQQLGREPKAIVHLAIVRGHEAQDLQAVDRDGRSRLVMGAASRAEDPTEERREPGGRFRERLRAPRAMVQLRLIAEQLQDTH